MSRLSLSDADKDVRDWFVRTTRQLNCTVRVDGMGNIFAVRKGRREGPPTFAGSQLDTQPAGGRYDGVLGVLAGLEALRVMEENQVETEYPVGVINWTNEEGARFPISMVSSGVWAGAVPLEVAYDCKEVGGESGTMKSELTRVGYLGDVEANHRANTIGAHFELHIEQGPILESSKKKIGIVSGVQAYRWYTIKVHGKEAHTGATDFKNRSDALLAASKMILRSHHVATELKGLASTGILTLKPGSTNTVPGMVRFSLDIRAHKDVVVEEMERRLKADFLSIAQGLPVGRLNEGGTDGRPCSVDWKLDMQSPETLFNLDCMQCVDESAASLFGDKVLELTERMTSGAGHDRYV
ncbi:MAG: hypothetical protein M1814_005673 [Vezdaea aestivalis]|nr:MAG: hypothetical protein M1814_005673 [Vezdaea aestivalis]